ncbi:hypothetical protein QN277_026380 [Acacia crassicarpa]|uniref:Uncharacterized protein n=1 Tax=Acacia crassicarpa TaxID=499986 RepID=A0AAE1MKN2_9FABA|nr:hypothetical protein QN277_026380 [Acacia crassicarpa]
MGIESVEMMMLRCVFNGSLSMQDMEVERRPYHKNCSCALHKSKGNSPATACQQRMISFTKRTRRCLSLKASKSSTQPHCFQSVNNYPEVEEDEDTVQSRNRV